MPNPRRAQLIEARGGGLSAGMGGDAAARIRQQLLMPVQTGKDVTLEYVSATSRYVWTPINGLYWTRWTIDQLATSGMWVVDTSTVYECIKGWSDRDASITYAPAWSQGANSGGLNNTWSYTKVATRYAQFSVTPGTDGKIYIVGAQEANGGIAYITIDGGTTLVNELPLVGANRELDFYAAAEDKNHKFLIASTLSIEPHTVRITVSGTKNASSSDAYIWLEGYGVTPYTIDDAQMILAYDRDFVRQIGSASSNSNEYAIHYLPAGASTYEWMGTSHLNEVYSAITWQDSAGNDISVSVGDTKNHGDQLIVTQTGKARHSQTSITDHATVTCKQTFGTAGLDVYHKHDWLTACAFDQAYPAMWRLLEAASAKGIIAGDTATYTLNSSDQSYRGQLASRLSACWNNSFSWVAWCYLPDLTCVNGWARSVYKHSIRDETGGTTNKIYLQRTGGADNVANETTAPGDSWESTVQYRISNVDPMTVMWT